jgi:hypothetical protein
VGSVSLNCLGLCLEGSCRAERDQDAPTISAG